MKTQQGKVSSAVAFVLAVLVIGGLVGGAGYWYGHRNAKVNSDRGATQPLAQDAAVKKDTSKASSTDDTKNPTACVSSTDPKTYSNKLIGLEFCYPKEWGEAVIGEPVASKSDQGSGYEIHFSAKDGAAVSSVTTDYINTIGRDGRCEDPTSSPPNFTQYSNTWIKDAADSELTAAARYPIKKDGVYLISDNANSFFWGICYSALINQTGTAYPVVKVALRKNLGETTVLQYITDPTKYLSSTDRLQLEELVVSVRKP